MALIGISGKIGSGKNTVASIIQYLSLQKDYPNVWKDKSFEFFLDYGKSHTWTSNWEKVAFADKLKQIVSILTGIPVEDLEKEEVKNRVLGDEWNTRFPYENSNYGDGEIQQYTVRKLMQKLEAEAMRNVIHSNIWCNALFSDYISEPHPNSTTKWVSSKWIITDMYLPNQMEAVKDKGGITIRVNRNTWHSISTLGNFNLIEVNVVGQNLPYLIDEYKNGRFYY